MALDRSLAFSSVFNFRDLGGFVGRQGRTVRHGRLYRSDGLHRLAGDDLEDFAELGIRTVLDLRRPDELEAEGRVVESPDRAYHNVNFHADMWPEADLTPEDMPRFLADRYADMADAALDGDVPVGYCLRLLSDARALPLVFHCAAGKDRTGVLAALTLSLLGVDDDDIAFDYARSAEARQRFARFERERRGEDWPLSAWEINPSPAEAMRLFLTELRERYGSVDEYVRLAGVDESHLAALRAELLSD
jgi:protein tyrosine/serine phosphatase